MSPGQPTERRRRWSATGVLALLAAIAALRVAAPVIMPVALAIIIAFMLSPLTGWLERRLGSVLAVAVVVALAWAMLGGLAWGVTQQVMTFTRELPEYRDQLRRRVAELRGMTRGAGVEQIEATLGELVRELEPNESVDAPVVVVRSPRPAILSAATVTRVSASAGLVTLLVVFVLLERQALRNRIVRLAGRGRLAMTTRALGDASVRISRYLLTQTTLNVAFGVAAGLGLGLLGMPYALGWGVLAAILKFVPFVGFWAAMAPPVLLTVATAPGWTQPALVAGLYLALAVGSTLLLEPALHAQRLGVSRVALVLGLAFWAWLWGPVGLVIATPLTVCLIVLGRHVPELRYIGILIGDDPALRPHLALYQRLLAGDVTEAAELAEAYRSGRARDAVLDDLVIPAIAAAKADRARGELSDDDVIALAAAFADVVRDFSVSEAEGVAQSDPQVLVIGCPAEDAFDHVALLALQASMPPSFRATMELVSPEPMSSEVVTVVAERRAAVVCVTAVSPGATAPVRYLVKRLRERLPEVHIVVAAFGAADTDDESAAITASGVDGVGTTVVEARDRLVAMIRFARGAASPAV